MKAANVLKLPAKPAIKEVKTIRSSGAGLPVHIKETHGYALS